MFSGLADDLVVRIFGRFVAPPKASVADAEPDDEGRAVPTGQARLPGFLCSKALDVRELKPGTFAVVDACGRQMPSFACRNHEQMLVELSRRAAVVPVAHADGSLLLDPSHPLDGLTIPWSLEEPYVARIPDLYRIWLCGRGRYELFDAKRCILPLAYQEAGFGNGSREMFEEIHGDVLKGAWPGANLVPREMLMAHLHRIQIGRLCDDQLALVGRAVTSFQRVLSLMRRAVRENSWALEQIGVSEIVHGSPLSADIATFVTFAVISAVSSMDVMTRFVGFVNDTELPPTKFRPPGTSYYADLAKMRPRTLPAGVLDRIRAAWSSSTLLPELVQFRHDLIHSTTALEIERQVYIGRGTDEVNSLPLCYAKLSARDCATTGQPVRFLGREFFTDGNRDMDEVLHDWLADIIRAHAVTAREIWTFIDEARTTATHTLAGT